MTEKLSPLFSHSFPLPVQDLCFQEDQQAMVVFLRDPFQVSGKVQIWNTEASPWCAISSEQAIPEFCSPIYLWSHLIILTENAGPAKIQNGAIHIYDSQNQVILETFRSCDLISASLGKLNLRRWQNENPVLQNVDLTSYLESPFQLYFPNQRSPRVDVVFYEEGSEIFKSLVPFINSRFVHEPVQGFEYWQNEKNVLLSYFCINFDSKELSLDNFLLWMDIDGNPILHQKINSGLKGKIFGTFMVKDTFICLVSHHKVLELYELR